jgi:hypothetical protein
MSQPLIRIRLRGREHGVASQGDRAKIDLTGKQAGQIIVVFALMLTTLIGVVGIAIDVTYAWRTGLQIQRAADSGALAGVVYLPGDMTSATTEAKAVVGSNGYTSPSSTITVSNAHDPHQLDVTVTASVPTFFIRLFGINSWAITRQARAGYQLPVPMGSPEAFYGVYCMTTTSNSNCPDGTSIAGAASTTVKTHGSWGAIQATGTKHGQGDAFIPFNDPDHSLGTNSSGGTNPSFDQSGYNYAVELPAGGDIYVYDPTACAVGGGHGTGDHYNDGALSSDGKVYSVSTYYKLYNMTSSPLNYAAQEPPVYTSGTLFEREYQWDQSAQWGAMGYTLPATSQDGVALKDCKEGATGAVASEGRFYHDKWWKINTSGLSAGTYRLNIQSAQYGAVNWKATFENDWSIEGVGGTDADGNGPRVYGLGKIVTYNTIQTSGTQSFYLAQIDPENAGKTLEIDLFDPGDINGVGNLSILSPNGNAWNAATFSYTSDANCGVGGSSDSCSASGRTSVRVANNGPHGFEDTWLHILIKLPSNYGCSIDPALTCLKPAGETQQGWWRIQYSTTSGPNNDTTTWMVSLVGNPVHLLPL